MKFTFSKKWIIFGFLALLICLLSLAALKFAPAYRGMVMLFLYTIPSNSFVSFLPHEPVMVGYGKIYNPITIAIIAGIATCVAGFIDYEVFTRVLNYKKIKNLYHNKRSYQKTIHYFSKAPFLTLAVAGFTPIPFSPFKFLGIASSYPEGKYILSLFVGRAPRYFVLALIGKAFNIPNWILVALFVLLLTWTLRKKIFRLFKGKVVRIEGEPDELESTAENS